MSGNQKQKQAALSQRWEQSIPARRYPRKIGGHKNGVGVRYESRLEKQVGAHPTWTSYVWILNIFLYFLLSLARVMLGGQGACWWGQRGRLGGIKSSFNQDVALWG